MNINSKHIQFFTQTVKVVDETDYITYAYSKAETVTVEVDCDKIIFGDGEVINNPIQFTSYTGAGGVLQFVNVNRRIHITNQELTHITLWPTSVNFIRLVSSNDIEIYDYHFKNCNNLITIQLFNTNSRITNIDDLINLQDLHLLNTSSTISTFRYNTLLKFIQLSGTSHTGEQLNNLMSDIITYNASTSANKLIRFDNVAGIDYTLVNNLVQLGWTVTIN